MNIPLFRSDAAAASHLDSKIPSDPWVTPLPHSTKNKKNRFLVFSPLPSAGPTLVSAIPPAQGPTNPAVSQLLMFKKPHLGISGGLFCDLFSLLSFRFSRCCSTRESANPVAVQLQFSCSFFFASACALLSSLFPPRGRPFSLLFALFPRLS